MSFYRLVYYSALLGGWGAFVGWLLSELLPAPPQLSGPTHVTLVACLVGAGIGAAMTLFTGLANGAWKQQLRRISPGLIGGAIGGALGGFLGNALYEAINAQSTAATMATRALG